MHECHLAVSLYQHSRLVRQVVFLTVAHGVVLMSYELVDGALIGSHQFVSPDRLPAVEARLDVLRAEWESDLDYEVRVHRHPPQILTS